MKKYVKIIILVVIVFVLFLIATTLFKSDDIKDFIEREEPTVKTVYDIQKEYPNTDIVGILQVPNTTINEPVVQTSDNDYYLNHDIYKKKNVIGSVFLDYRVDIDDSRKILIYGHNSKTLNPPFHQLEKYYDEEFALANREIKLITNEGEHTYEVFSFYVEPVDYTYMNIKFATDEAWLEHITGLKEKSWYDYGTDVGVDDHILLLQSCSYHPKYKKYEHKYIILAAKKIN